MIRMKENESETKRERNKKEGKEEQEEKDTRKTHPSLVAKGVVA